MEPEILVKRRELVRHLPESALEEYPFGRLSKYRAERVEDHVRSCRESTQPALFLHCLGPG
jgi:hypothetical protein